MSHRSSSTRRTRRSSPRSLRTVHVNPYYRWRFQRWETVCEHWRTHPGQMAFDFNV
ncbi:hypothetical protein SAMN05216206_2588 [Pseudomonas guineae]|uniref:Uncharacterized protein n=1 Tax=Pseudomonas guineae TaxID=425504 RepID=A0A1I3JRU4_9PSED|nr:hypothetical protein SAMN05216206_2588 [Pseudomonas guineae]